MKNYKRKNCRLCKSKNLKTALVLTPTPAADSYLKKNELKKELKKIPLTIMLCKKCGHSQLSHVINAKQVYLNYIYETASTLGLDNHFKTCADEVIEKYNPRKKGLVVDIGSNDGILLYFFKKKGMNVLGVDPMPGIAKKAKKNGVKTLELFFNKNEAQKIKKKYGYAEIITSNNLVADTDNLDDFIKGIKELMNDDTIFFFETFYFYSQVKNFVWDFTYHEHYSYFTVGPLVKYFKEFGLEIIDVVKNNTKGGSMRVVVQKIGAKRKIMPNVSKFQILEKKENLNQLNGIKKYGKKIEDEKNTFIKFADNLFAGKKIAGYGASATSTTLIYHYKLNKYLNYLVDDFKAKINLFSPGYKIPVYEGNYLIKDKPDYTILLAWRYAKKIIRKNLKYVKDGGQFIIPLPKIKIIHKNNYKNFIK
jgi:hypothetical protein